MYIVNEIEKTIPLFRNRQYFYKLSSLLKIKSKSKVIKEKQFLISSIIPWARGKTESLNFWYMIAQNIVNTKTEKENNFSSNLIEKYLAYKVKKVINALTLFEVKTKIKLDVLIDLYIFTVD